MNTYHYPSKIVFIDDGVTGTVTVHDLPDGDRLIAVDGVDVAGMDLMLRTTQKLQAYVPLLVHRNPQDVVQIGYGSGETCGIGLDFGVAHYSIVDICPGVFTAGAFFREINRGSFENPRLRKIIMDGKNFIKLTNEKFDVIMNDSTYPGTTGSSALYTYDHFKACHDHLKPRRRPVVLGADRPSAGGFPDHRSQLPGGHAALLAVDGQQLPEQARRPARDPGADAARSAAHQRDHEPQPISRPTSDRSASIRLMISSTAAWSRRKASRQLGGSGPLHTDDRPHLEYGVTIKRDIETCWQAVLAAMADVSHAGSARTW